MNRSATLTTAALCLGFATLFLQSATAQPPRTPNRGPVTLADVVAEITWDPSVRGPLIIVAPEKARAARGEGNRPAQPAPAPGPDGYSVNALAPYFDFRLVPCGTVAAFAPATMKVLATRLPRPDIDSSLTRGDRLALLQGTFSEAQWRQLASEQGLGANDLSGRQREMFLALLPDPMVVYRLRADATGKTSGEQVTLSAAQRASARISLRKRVTWVFPAGKDGESDTSTSGDGRLSPNSETLAISGDSGLVPGLNERGKVFGAALVEEQRARLKPGDLPFDWNGLDPVISLTAAKTVGELVERIRQATRAEIYCDRRYAELPVALWGGSARSGDVLTALCYGVTGTFRKVGPAFILTDDREGLGTRTIALQEWVEAAKGEVARVRQEITAGLARRPADLTRLDPSDPTASDRGLAGKIVEFEKRIAALSPIEREKPENRGVLVPITELPPDARYRVEGQVRSLRDTGFGERTKTRTDMVRLKTYEVGVLVIPGVGVAQMPELTRRMGDNEMRFPPAEPSPEKVEVAAADRALIVSPGSPEEAITAVKDAKQRGFQRLWVAVRPEDVATVEAAVKAGKVVGIPVGAVIRVLRAGADTSLPRDRNLAGEDSTAYAARASATPAILFAGLSFFVGSAAPDFTAGMARRYVEREKRWGAWLQCDAPEVQAAALRRVTAIARVPGSAGLVLRDLHAPGYGPPTRRYFNDTPPRSPETLGYNEAARLAFLRQYGVDPIDLGPGQRIQMGFDSMYVALTYMPDYGLTGKYATVYSAEANVSTFELGAKDAPEKWLEFRVAAGNRFAESFVRGLRAAAPGVPLWVYPHTNDLPFVAPRWLTRLDDGEAGIRLAAPAPEPLQNVTLTDGGVQVGGAPTLTGYQLAMKGTTAVSYALWGTFTQNETARQHFRKIAALEWPGVAKDGWQSVTVDLSDETMDAVPRFLDGITFVKN